MSKKDFNNKLYVFLAVHIDEPGINYLHFSVV